MFVLRRTCFSTLVLFTTTLFAFVGDEREARADQSEDTEYADGSTDCRAFRARNEKEMAAWEKTQPAVPYAYPREDNFLNAPWGGLFGALGKSGELVLATMVPHVGAQFRGDAPAAFVAWPLSFLVIGPMYACSRKKETFVVHGHRVHRFMIEPAVTSSNRGIGFAVRPGYRFIWHPTTWVVGPGIGIGSTVEIKGNQEPFRYGVSPELVAHFGNCCRQGYFIFSARWDHYFKGNVLDIYGGSLGYTFF